ncbi:thioredoxin-like protein [Polychytrium aggregatum]|uniref:thioredoxin-like protein n=1 Tax=Polychytrium aggregatum TaxID=110093 RepID=UPI0022FE2C04|nr:thioredoxin-like protein [Polychytrium aggregatum]KAI9202448.1 thioredoxin-like protein [Polychytrium aggregatum]
MSSDSPFYSFKINDLRGKPLDLAQFRGKVVVVVNVASKCGLTPQYTGLEKLYQDHKDEGLVIIGCPSNSFNQEHSEVDAIETVCQRNYGVSFPITEVISVNGSDEHPLYNYLKSEAPGILGLKMIKWNFEKFLVDRDGKVIRRFAPTTVPADMEKDIVAHL